MARTWRIVGIDFSHMHMGDNLRFAHEHPAAEIVGIWDEEPRRMAPAIEAFGLADRVYSDWRECLAKTAPDLVILCPPTGAHADWIERVAPHGAAILMEKPFAASLADADRMIAAASRHGATLAINWPLAWYPPHVTAKRLIDEGAIGRVTHVNYYDGNRGPLYHLEGKRETTAAFRAAEKAKSWFYRRAEGGGALLDYLGYGATLGTWFLGGAVPFEVACLVDEPAGLEVDEHSITIARYETGLCRFETRWGTFTDPWVHQPQPKCGFEINGTEGTITSYDYETAIRVQTRAHPEGRVLPVDVLAPPRQDPVQYVLHCLEHGARIEGPLSPALCRIGQRIVDSAVRAAREKRTVRLLE
ncbi:MAG: Gfo/Idh/MocA family oxidoreductase [Planctomycetota bacterium]